MTYHFVYKVYFLPPPPLPMPLSHHSRQQHQKSQTPCRLGATCKFKRENKCKYYHAPEEVVPAATASSPPPSSSSSSGRNEERESEEKKSDVAEYSISNDEPVPIQESVNGESGPGQQQAPLSPSHEKQSERINTTEDTVQLSSKFQRLFLCVKPSSCRIAHFLRFYYLKLSKMVQKKFSIFKNAYR